MQSLSEVKTPTPTLEDKVIKKVVNNSEATMNTNFCISVAYTLLQLQKKYPLPAPSTPEKPLIDSEQLSNHLKDMARAYFPQHPEYIDAIESFIKRTKEPLDNALDVVTLTVEGKTQKMVFPLQEVLFIVLQALKDHQAYIKNYTGTDEEQLQASAKDFPNRLHTLFNFFLIDSTHCHTGLRNGLVTVLNGVHPQVTLVEDIIATIMAFSKDWVSQHFWSAWQESDTDDKKVALDFLLQWLKEGDVRDLLHYLQLKVRFFSEIVVFFQQQGFDFTTQTIDQIPALTKTEDILTQLGCSYDYCPHEFPIKALAYIMGLPDYQLTSEQKNSLNAMRVWIETTYHFDNPNHNQAVQLFTAIFQNYRLLVKHQDVYTILLSQDWVEHRLRPYQSYFTRLTTAFTEAALCGDGVPLLTLDALQATHTEIERAFTTNAIHLIENFFADWYAKKSTQRPQLYLLLLDENFTQGMSWTDEQMQNYCKLHKTRTEDGTWNLSITTYTLNRFFLHAIINPPATWSGLFSENFAQLLAWVKKGFDNPEDFRAQSLKKSSYPPLLLEHMTYLLRQSPHYQVSNEQTLITLPFHAIALPEYCKDAESISFFFKLLKKIPHQQREFLRRLPLTQEEFGAMLPALVNNLKKNSRKLVEISCVNWEEIQKSTTVNDLRLYLEYLGTYFLDQYNDLAWIKSLILTPDAFDTAFCYLPAPTVMACLEKIADWNWVAERMTPKVVKSLAVLSENTLFCILANLVGCNKNLAEWIKLLKPLTAQKRFIFLEKFPSLLNLVGSFKELSLLLEILPSDQRPSILAKLNYAQLKFTVHEEIILAVRMNPPPSRSAILQKILQAHPISAAQIHKLEYFSYLVDIIKTIEPDKRLIFLYENDCWPLVTQHLETAFTRDLLALLALFPHHEWEILQKIKIPPFIANAETFEQFIALLMLIPINERFSLLQQVDDWAFKITWLYIDPAKIKLQSNFTTTLSKLFPAEQHSKLLENLNDFPNLLSKALKKTTSARHIITVLEFIPDNARFSALQKLDDWTLIASVRTKFSPLKYKLDTITTIVALLPEEQQGELLGNLGDVASLINQTETRIEELVRFLMLIKDANARFAILMHINLGNNDDNLALLQLIDDSKQRVAFLHRHNLWQDLAHYCTSGEQLALNLASINVEQRIEILKKLYYFENIRRFMRDKDTHEKLAELIPNFDNLTSLVSGIYLPPDISADYMLHPMAKKRSNAWSLWDRTRGHAAGLNERIMGCHKDEDTSVSP